MLFGREGNLSCRLDSGDILITPAGKTKSDLTPEQLVLLSPAGKPRSSAQNPSSEWRLHQTAYAANSEINATVHLHPPYSTAFAVAERVLDITRFTEAESLLGEVRLIESAPPGSQELADAVAAKLDNCSTFLLARHGLVCFGADLEQAKERAIAAEHCAQVLWLAEFLRNSESNSK